LELARSKIKAGAIDKAGLCFGEQPRIYLRTWLSANVSGPIAEDVNKCILKLENHRSHLRTLVELVKSSKDLKWEGEKFRHVLYYWKYRDFEITIVLFELLKSIDFAMGWGLNKPSRPFPWEEYEKHPQTKTIAADDGDRADVLADGLSSDKRSIRWHGKTYTLGLAASKVVELLHNRYLAGEYFLHEQFIKEEAEIDSDMRHIVRDNALGDLIVRQKKPNGKPAQGMWGLSPE
jgi:hypothetical protein